jgi:ABC-type amino acid transport substrate-binding protein
MPQKITEHLVKAGTLTVSTINDIKPMIFQNQHGQWDGYEVEILRKITKKINLDLNFIIEPFDKIWLSPQAGNYDIAAAALTILPSRISENTQFTQPIFYLDQSLLIRTTDKGFLQDIKDFLGRTIGIIPGTTGEANAKAKAPKGTIFREYADENTMLASLELGQIDAIARGTLGNSYQAQTNKAFTMIGIMPTGEKIAFAVSSQNNILAELINQEILEMKKNGHLIEIYKKWFYYLDIPDDFKA